MCSILWCIDRNSHKRKNELVEATLSFSLSIEVKSVTVRIVHAGGREELYHNAIPASKLLHKYPGMCLTSPEIFKRPHESVISADDDLVPGKKYYLIPSTTVWKLKRKHSDRKKVKVAKVESVADSKEATDISEDLSTFAVKDLYVSKDDQPKSLQKNPPQKKKPFVPPIEKQRTWKEYDWEPSLHSIEEISP